MAPSKCNALSTFLSSFTYFKWSENGKKKKNGAYEIITALNSFHGRTMMNVSATGQPHYQELFEPIPTGFTHVPYNDLDEIKKATNDNTVAVMIEPVQGEGGVNVPSEDYLKGVREWLDFLL